MWTALLFSGQSEDHIKVLSLRISKLRLNDQFNFYPCLLGSSRAVDNVVVYVVNCKFSRFHVGYENPNGVTA